MTDDRLSQLYRTYGTVIYDRCRSMLEDAAEAEDATHETFLRLHRQLAKLPPSREAVFWIYRVATNYCLNELRNRKRRAAPVGTVAEDCRRPERPIPSARLADWDSAQRLIAGAPAKVRVVAWLYHVDGFQRDEVAGILRISERTVTARLSKFASGAKKYLRSNGL